jgi:hypothetical protein
MATPPSRDGAAGQNDRKLGAPIYTRPAPIPQHRCASCGSIGRLSLADPQHDDHQRPVLRLDWRDGCRLLCPMCRP